MSRRSFATLVGAFGLVLLAMLGLIWAVAWVTTPMYLIPARVYEPDPFATAAEAVNASPIPLPPEAVNVRIATYSQFIALEEYVRFEATVDVCLRHAAQIVKEEPLTPVTAEQLHAEGRVPDDVFRDLRWFDLTEAHDVVGAGGGSHRPQVWVDRRRGVFYYRLTD